MPVAHTNLYAQSWNTNFGPNPFEDSAPNYTQNTDDNEYVPVEVPKNNHPPSLKFPKISEGAQWNRPLNAKKKIMMKSSKKFKMMKQKSPKRNQKNTTPKNTPETQTQKTPENSETTPLDEEPIYTRGEKQNLRPNPNPNYSDSYRY